MTNCSFNEIETEPEVIPEVLPTSIISLQNHVYLTQDGSCCFEVIINPSNAKVCLETDSIDAGFSLNLVSKSRASYITSPDNYLLQKVEPSIDSNGEVLVGKYKVTIKDLGITSCYSEEITLVFKDKTREGEEVLVSSGMIMVEWGEGNVLDSFKIGNYVTYYDGDFINVRVPYGEDITRLQPTFLISDYAKVYVNGEQQHSGVNIHDFTMPVEYVVVSKEGLENHYYVSVSYSDLPVIYIDTPAPIKDKENWISNSRIYVTNAGKNDALYEKANLKGRGNSTWMYDKKPYAIKLNKKAEVLGMPKHKRWVLLANYIDRTTLRNSAAFEIAKCAKGLPWTPRGYFVDVVMNGKFLGNYYLCEQIKIDSNRVNITEYTSGDSSEDAITGGYLLEYDTYYDEVNKFRTAIRDLPVNIKEPDDDVLLAKQFTYLQDYINGLEKLLYSDNFPGDGDYREMLDVTTFADWWLVTELIQNAEAYWPKSVYMYKDRGGKLCAGPIWDSDYATFQKAYNKWLVKDAVYYGQLFKDPFFVNVVKERWELLKSNLLDIGATIHKIADQNKPSVIYNNEIWKATTTINKDEALYYDDAVVALVKSIQDRITWMDAKIEKF